MNFNIIFDQNTFYSTINLELHSLNYEHFYIKSDATNLSTFNNNISIYKDNSVFAVLKFPYVVRKRYLDMIIV